MTAAEMLKKAGFPDTEAGRKAFYKKYPSQDSFMKKFAKGGDTELAFPQQPNSNQFFNMGTPASFPGPFYAHGGSHMPLVHYAMAGAVGPNPQMEGTMMDNSGGTIPFATKSMGTPGVEDLPRFDVGGTDDVTAAQIVAIREEYGPYSKKQLREELKKVNDNLSEPYTQGDPVLIVRKGILTEMLGGKEGEKARKIREHVAGFPYRTLPYEQNALPEMMSEEDPMLSRSRMAEGFPYRELPMKKNRMQEMGFDYRQLPFEKNTMQEMNVEDVPFDPSMMQRKSGGAINQIAFPQQPVADQFFTGAHFNNQYRKGGAPCYECGGSYDVGGNTPFNYGYFPMSMMAMGGVGLDRADQTDDLIYQRGGQMPQGLTMDDYRKSQQNQFTKFLSDNTQAYNAGQVMQQGQMEGQMEDPMQAQMQGQMAPPQNQMGGYNAMMPGINMSYGPGSNTEGFSGINMGAYNNINASERALENLTDEGAGKNFMGQLYGLMANKQMQKQQQAAANKQAQELMKKNQTKTQAKYGYFLPKHNGGANTTTTTNTTTTNTGTTGGTGTTGNPPTYLTKEDLTKWWEETQKKQQGNTQQQQQQQQGFFNPYTGSYQPAGFGFMGAPIGSRYKIKIKGRGTLPFSGAGDGSQGQGVDMSQGMAGMPGMMSGMSPENFAKYMDAMNKSGFKGELKTKMGLLGRWLGPRKQTLSWSFGNPAAQQPPVQGPLDNPNKSKPWPDPKNAINPKTIAGGYDWKDPANVSNMSNAPVVNQPNNIIMRDYQPENMPVTSAIPGMGYGGQNYYDDGGIVWMDDDQIREFEQGGGVLEYVNGGQFRQYY